MNGFVRPTFTGSRRIQMNGARFMDQLVAPSKGAKRRPNPQQWLGARNKNGPGRYLAFGPV
jgi:hypothetical protein